MAESELRVDVGPRAAMLAITGMPGLITTITKRGYRLDAERID